MNESPGSSWSPAPVVLGIDHGEVRIGLAISDDLAMLAHPLETIDCRKANPVNRLIEGVRERSIATLVCGLPLRMDGTEGTAAAKVRAFMNRVQKRLPEISIVFVDERLSTTDAQSRLHAAGRTVRNSRPIIDQAAATIILQDYLDQQENSFAGPDFNEL